MEFASILLIAVSLAMDACAVSLGAAATGRARGARAEFRLWFHFGLFQFLMPVIGWFVGSRFAGLITGWSHWLACGLLVWVGARMIRASLQPAADALPPDPTRGLTLVMLSLATSIDALAIGLSLAMLQVAVWYPSAVIGLVTAGLSFLALKLGNRLGAALGARMERLGGVILILVGLRILLFR